MFSHVRVFPTVRFNWIYCDINIDLYNVQCSLYIANGILMSLIIACDVIVILPETVLTRCSISLNCYKIYWRLTRNLQNGQILLLISI